MFTFEWVDNNLAVGSAFDDSDIPKIAKWGVDAIIDVRAEGHDDEARIKEAGMEYLHVDVADRCAPTQKQLIAIFRFALPLIRRNKKIFVHCHHGNGRSPLVIISILVERGMSVSDAIRLVKEKYTGFAITHIQENFIRGLIETTEGDY